ncbi:MAG: hypothetical protein HUU35_09735, partial [Armatimonadetes bacterium]|nr:hypothetical protein [Armatimonadota bacterium]
VYDPAARQALPAQFEPSTPGGREGLLVVRLSGELAPNAERRLEVLAQAGKSSVLAPAGSYWLAGEQRVETPFYGLNLASGMVTDIEWRPNPKPGPAVSFVSYSNAVTGWTTETGRTEALEVLAAGPVRTVLRLKRNLAEGKAIFTRTYAFYADWFEVTTDARPSLTGLHNRFHYVREATYVDSAAKTTRIDGKGDDDDKISGAPPAWVAVIGDGWAHSMIPLEKPTGLTYWDGGSWGGLGYSGTAERSRQAFVFHGSCPDASFAAADAARLQNPVRLE